MKTTIQLAIVGIILLTACKKNERGVTQALEPTTSGTTSTLNQRAQADMEFVYYNSILEQIKLMQFSEQPSESHLEYHKGLNILYRANGFVTVAIQGNSNSAIWREVNIVYSTNITPYQFYNEARILNAARGRHPQIGLFPTNKVFRGSIIQQ